MRTLLVPLVAVLLAGCATPEPPASDGPAAPEPVATAVPFETGSCYEYHLRIPVEAPPLPEGFSEAGPGYVWAFVCRLPETGGNGSDEERRTHVSLLFEGVSVRAPAPYDGAPGETLLLTRVAHEDDQEADAAMLRSWGIVPTTARLEFGYNSMGPTDHVGGFTEYAESIRSVEMVGGPATIAPPPPLRLVAVDPETGEVSGVVDVATSAACISSGPGERHAGEGIVPTDDPASVERGDAQHVWGIDMTRRFVPWGPGLAAPGDASAPSEGVTGEPIDACGH